LIQGEPRSAIETLQNKVWSKSVTKAALEEYKTRYTVLATRLVGGQPRINVFSDTQPEDGFVQVEPDLEDVYFLQLRRADGVAAPVADATAAAVDSIAA
jgi:hypothetical protein